MTRQLITDQPFDLDAVLNGTQDFRWRPWRDGWHSGVLNGNLVHVRQVARGVEYSAASDLDSLLISYFRLNDDLAAIYDDISRRDDNMARLAQEYPWLRILRQPDPWECTVSYICSATNNVSRISAIVEKIAAALGRRLELDGEVRNTFPTSKMVLEAGVGALEQLNLGLDRHSKIVAAAERIRDGRLDLRLSRPARGVLRRGEASADGVLRHRKQDCRLHRAIRAGKDGGVPGGQVGGRERRQAISRAGSNPPATSWRIGRGAILGTMPAMPISSCSLGSCAPPVNPLHRARPGNVRRRQPLLIQYRKPPDCGGNPWPAIR